MTSLWIPSFRRKKNSQFCAGANLPEFPQLWTVLVDQLGVRKFGLKDFASFVAIAQGFKDTHALNKVLLDYKSIFNRYKTKLPLDNDKLVRLGRQAVEVRNASNPHNFKYQISTRYRRQRCLSGTEVVVYVI